MCAYRGYRGFTLIEALVAMVVLSIGMLGIAALGIESLRASRAALVRTGAVTLATDMADRIRVNQDEGDDPMQARMTALRNTLKTALDSDWNLNLSDGSPKAKPVKLAEGPGQELRPR